MFLHGSERHVVVRGELAHGCVGGHDPRQDVATGGVGEGPEQRVHFVRNVAFIYNHVVVDSSTLPDVRSFGSEDYNRSDTRHE